MSVDVYEDHIRFLGYHVPIDLSKLPPTARDSLVRTIQEAVDTADHDYSDEIADAEDLAASNERERICEMIRDALDTDNVTDTERVAAANKIIDKLETL
jgi:hypothetical protein